jgi:hypothetical protein
MVLPCIPCAAAAAPAIGPSVAAFLGISTTGALVVNKSLKKNKTKKKKKKKISQKGGSKVMKKTKRKRKIYKYNVFKKDIDTKCCRCHYVKSGKNLRKVRGPYSHCSYDMNNCCKYKKTIVKSKK